MRRKKAQTNNRRDSGDLNKRQIARDDDNPIEVLRTSGSIAIIFLVAYFVYDVRGKVDASSIVALYHWISISAALLFFGVTWVPLFRRHWKFWVIGFCISLIWFFILISGHTHDSQSRYIALLLFPIATASFVNWGWRWQIAMNAVCVGMYAVAQALVPLAGDNGYRWMGLFAAIALAEATAIFMQRYRERIKEQLQRLIDAAAFRESQIATMAHDIRSPLAALTGFVDLLQDEDLSADERQRLIARIGSTAWNMDLAVANVLDLYQLEEGYLRGIPSRIHPGEAIAEAAETCAAQAERKGVRMITECGEFPEIEADPRFVGRVVRNFLAFAIARPGGGEVLLKAYVDNGTMAVKVRDDGPALTAREVGTMFMRPGESRNARANLGLYIARTLVESVGGRVDARPLGETGLELSAEFPVTASSRPDS